MIVYLSICGLAVFFALVGAKTENRFLRFLGFALAFCVLFVPAAIRYDIGTDYSAIYPIKFAAIADDTYDEGEPLFVWIVKIVQGIESDPFVSGQYIFALISLLTYAFFFVSFNTKILWLAILSYFFTQSYTGSYNAIRQMMAVSILMMSLRVFQNKHWVAAVAIAAAAALMHKSAAIFTVIYVFLQWYDKYFSLRIVSFVVFSLTVLALTFPVQTLMWKIAELLGVFEQYMGDAHYQGGHFLSTGLGFFALVIADALCFAGMLIVTKNRWTRVMAVLCGLNLLVRVVGSKAIILARLSVLFSFVTVFAVCELWESNMRFRKLYVGSILVVLLVVFIRDMIPDAEGVAANGVIPYDDVFSAGVW